jgi:hypothetical protein
VVISRAAHEATGFDKDAFNRSIEMSAPTMGPTTDFKQWKRNFLNFRSLKATYLIPQVAIRDSGVWLDEQAQHYAYTPLLHDNKRADHAMKCVSHARPDFANASWDILCESLECRSFARSLSLLDNLMLMQTPAGGAAAAAPEGGCVRRPVGTYLYLHAVGACNHVAVPGLAR